MTPAPTLQELIETVERDAPSSELLDMLATASSTVAQLEEVADAVLGHFVDRCRRHGHSWTEISTALGVSKQAAHKRFSFTAPTLERFTERARRAVDAAAKAARALGHNFVGTEHLLLGLFDQPDGLAARALAEAGVDPAAVEAKVLEVVPRGSEPLLDNPLYTPRASLALQAALDEALRLGHNYIGTEHILLGLLKDRDGLAARTLNDLGVNAESIRARLVELVNALAARRRQE
ncbi:MAG TPA: Clp protease N-terminal domain-containing protein [Acidimicrobiia bacterium]|nr:Clp protease N-terminal domain-containing protein [Acidimicrobiia bacterium]